jgi:hypothetical protein
VVAVSLGLAAALLSALYIDHAYTTRASYPGVDVQGLAAQIRQHELPGDHVFVSELMRYPWALYEDQPLVVQLGEDWSTGFTVVSTNPNVFIAPSEFYEEASRPEAWARDMTRGPYTRLWYVWTSPLVGYNPSYAALEDDGWRPVRTLTAADCAATLLVRGS